MVCSKCGSADHNARKCDKKEQEKGQECNHALTMTQRDKFIRILDIVEKVGKALHKGRQECVYQKGIAAELSAQCIKYTAEEVISVLYYDVPVGYERMDLFLYELGLILELKAVAGDIKQEFIWQLVNYMREKKVGLGMVVNYSQGVGKGIQFECVFEHEGSYWIWNCAEDTMTALGDGGY